MFSSALKSFSSNINNNYSLAPQPNSISGPWKIFDAKHKKTSKAVSVFVFDKKSLEPQQAGGLGGRSSASSLKRVHEEVVDRLKREASSLARLRHPSILELVEPVEDTRHGGLQFATEPVTASLAGLLLEKDDQERSGGAGGRSSRFVVEEADGSRKRRELEIDELEIQKGLLQLGKGLEFLHESAGLVHANLTPDAVLVNAKGDWKIAGLSFCGPHESSNAATSLPPISLHEVLNHDPRLPASVQLNLNYTSPDFVMDNQLTPAADIFSLGLLIVALYNSPHTSPLNVAGSLSGYKRIFSSASTIPTQQNNFQVPSSHPLPPKLASELLPRLITRRPAQRLSAREFQEASYFDNILVSTIRFLDALPAKTPNEKIQFMRGLPRIMPQFPKSVMEKKVLPALLEEMKDKDLLAPILTNVFAMVKAMPAGKRAFTERVVPKLREVFLTNRTAERDASKEAGLVILLENMEIIGETCAGKEYHEDILPIILLALESPTHALVDTALTALRFILPALDFSTIKNELFPVIATVFAKTSSLNIKVRGLEAFYILCGGTSEVDDSNGDDLNGFSAPEKKKSPATSSIILDKYTVQEKVVPLMKGIKTKEPGVMMAALKVFGQVGKVADSDYLAMEVLPILWTLSLGPLLNLPQFQAFMALIKSISSKIEHEQTRKLQELSSSDASGRANSQAWHGNSTAPSNGLTPGAGDDADFESLVSGRKAAATGDGDLMNDWGAPVASSSHITTSRPAAPRMHSSSSTVSRINDAPTFSWQSPSHTPRASVQSIPGAPIQPSVTAPAPRTITPDLAAFASLTPSSPFAQPLEASRPTAQPTYAPSTTSIATTFPNRSASSGTSIDWSSVTPSTTSPTLSSHSWQQQPTPYFTQRPINPSPLSSYTAAPAPTSPSFAIPPPPGANRPLSFGQQAPQRIQAQALPTPPPPMPPQQQPPKSGLSKYESLL